MGQNKEFCMQRIPESECVGKQTVGIDILKQTVDIDILITSRNGDRKLMLTFRIIGGSALKMRKRDLFS